MIQLGQGNRKAGVVATSLYMKEGGVIWKHSRQLL